MTETTHATTTTPKTKAKAAATGASHFENAFAGATFEAPAAFREFAEKGLSQAKDGYEKMKSAAEEATSLMEGAYTSASKGAADYGLKLIEIARTNSNAAFDYASELMGAKSLSEAVELSTTHARKQFETLSAQTHELTALAQKVATDAAEPLKDGMSRMVKKVA
jgi:phasin